jgi:hypothetical protein
MQEAISRSIFDISIWGVEAKIGKNSYIVYFGVGMVIGPH